MVKNILLSSILLSLPHIVSAQASEYNDTAKVYNLNPITVTATTTETPRNLVSPSISVISNDDIHAHPEESVFSLISQEVPGVFVQERDVLGFGVNTSAGLISIRGIGGNPNTEVLTLIDGRPQYMGLMGHPINDEYLSANIERVEIIRGPASLLYGSNAMAGVINIITHKNIQQGFSGDAGVSYGSFDSQHYGLRLGYQSDDWNIIGSFATEHTDGSRPWSTFDAQSGYMKSSYRIDEEYAVTIDGSATKFHTYDPGTVSSPLVNNWMDISRGYIGASIDNNYSFSTGALRLMYNFGHNELYTTWVSDDYIVEASLYQSFKFLSNTTITIGADGTTNGGRGHDSSKDYGTPSIDEYAMYTNIQHLLLARLLLTAGVRYDNNQLFGSFFTPQFGVTYRLSEETSLRTSAGKGFRNPTIRELYLFPAPTPTLQPENLWNYEIGISHSIEQSASLDLAAFIIDADNIIETQGNYPNLTLSNSGHFIHRGVEFSGRIIVSELLDIQSSYAYTDAANQTQSVPRHKLFLGGNYRYDIFSASVTAQFVNTIYGGDYQQNQLPNYTDAGIKIGVQIMRLSFSFGINNMFNQSYQTTYGYPMPGRTFTAGIRSSI